MPKGEKKKIQAVASDVTLSDFADCTATGGRLRKSAANLLNIKKTDYDSELLWHEKDLEEFEFPENETAENLKKKPSSSKHSNLKGQKEVTGIRYPLDLWFLLSKYIKPEDVCIFTLLCKDSYFVSKTYTFWINIYKRYHNPKVYLPYRLQSDSIERPLYLKACVIRALYHMYSHFINQLETPSPNAIYNLTNLCCTSVWHEQKKGKWLFYFKLKSANSFTQEKSMSLKEKHINYLKASTNEILKNIEVYVNDNPDEGYKVLCIVSYNFVVVPQFIVGSRLTDIKKNLSHDMCRKKIRLTFCFSTYKQFHGNVNGNKGFGGYGEIVEFDPVKSIKVMNWWHPQYPVSY